LSSCFDRIRDGSSGVFDSLGSRLNSLLCLVKLSRRSGSFQGLAFADHLISPLNADRRFRATIVPDVDLSPRQANLWFG
jgi:hypothetical protein